MNRSLLRLFKLIPLLIACNSAISNPIFTDGFESQNLKTSINGVSWGSSAYTQISNEKAKDGIYSLKFSYAPTDDTKDSWSEQRFSLGKAYKEIWISYDILIPENYFHRTTSYGSSNNKGFIMLWSGDYSNPTGPEIGTEFWPNQDGSSTASIRLAGVGFDKHYWQACPGIVEISDRGKWITIIAHLKYASANNNDGVVQIWKTYADGKIEQPCNMTDGAWYTPNANGFESGYIMGWSNSGFNEQTNFYVDNFKVSETPLKNIPSPPRNASFVTP